MKKLAPIFSFVLLTSLFLNFTQTINACGPSFLQPIFEFEHRGESFEDYARGEIGVVRPDFNRSFLFAAYRQFNNSPFTANEQKDLNAVWQAEFENTDVNEGDTNAAIKTWIESRKKVLTNEAEPKIYTANTYNNSYELSPNCTKNAFETAAKTLDNRAKTYSATDENVKNWARAQDAVFTLCSSQEKVLPVEATSNAPQWLKNDREYQIAAANFYAMNFDDAKARFEKIAANRDSVWNETANYLIARNYIRQASLENKANFEYYSGDDAKQKEIQARMLESYKQAETKLQSIVNDDKQTQYKDSARKLLNLVAYRLRPNERRAELAKTLLNKNENSSLRSDLTDYRWLLDKLQTAASAKAETEAAEKAKQSGKTDYSPAIVKTSDFPVDVRADELTDWIFTFQSDDVKDSYAHSLERYKTTNEKAWLVAAISKAQLDSADVSQLMSAQVEKVSPAFATVSYHQIRLMIDANKQNEARAKLDNILADKNLKLPVTSTNSFKAQRMKLAQNLDDFLRDAQRRASAFGYDQGEYLVEDISKIPAKADEDFNKDLRAWTTRTMFDRDAAQIFNNQLPLETMAQASKSAVLPDYLKRNVLIATWTKAVLLENDAIAKTVAPDLVKYAPEFQTPFQSYLTAKTATERRSEALYVLLKNPALRTNVESGYGRTSIAITEIDSYRDNWWTIPSDTAYTANGQEPKPIVAAPTPFLNATQINQGKAERQKLVTAGNAASYLPKNTVEFATKYPNDARVPEMLSLAVRATRYSFRDCETGKYSKQAFDILKARFANSEFKKKTPYWYKDESCEAQK
ncbi:MAG: hypothetical protein H7Z37_10855 [Pyrinomonadaceae bacterium]|nr:hypothetical protein [Pyrinomonadaceae bacterium]